MKCSQPYQFNVIHVLASAKIPVARLPIDVLIANTISYNRKNERRGDKDQKKKLAEGKMATAEVAVNVARDKMEKEAAEQ